jgi:hypothetical protein
MALKIANKTIKELRHWHDDGELNLSPDFQRREVWGGPKKMLLIDSIARGIPVNALTFFAENTEDGIKHDVIDGKQRLTSIFEYFSDGFVPNSEVINEESEEEKGESKEKADAIANKKWSELKKKVKDDFLNYEIPIYFVSGPRDSAVKSFRRMNERPYALKPQEIRNAVYKNSYVLDLVRKLSINLKDDLNTEEDLFVSWGVITKDEYFRMGDVQFYSELLNLKINGPQNRRETLDAFYNEYIDAKPKKRKKLEKHAKELRKALSVIYSIFGDSLVPHFRGENKAYSLVGAFLDKDLYKSADLDSHEVRKQIEDLVKYFGDQVIVCEDQMTSKTEDNGHDDKTPKEVHEFTKTLLGGQKNSKKRREERILILQKILNEIVNPPDPRKPTEAQRRYIWAKSKDKVCGKCHKKVESYADYDCGHIDSGLFGGRCINSNLQVEHVSCNRRHNRSVLIKAKRTEKSLAKH